MTKLHVKTGDKVVVIAGKNKGDVGEVLRTIPEDGRVVVKDVNIQTHHNKPRKADDKNAGIVKVEGPIDASNVQVICPSCGKATRVAHSIVDGKSVRVCKKCGAELAAKVVKAKKTTKKTK